MKIDAPQAWGAEHMGKLVTYADETPLKGDTSVRIVRESDWRKIMAVVKAAEQDDKDGRTSAWATYPEKIADLRKHLEKRK